MNNPLDYFDAIYCINLDERTDRWEFSLKQFEKLEISDRVERFSAIRCQDIKTRNELADSYGINLSRKKRWYRFPRPGAIGNCFSHLEIVKLAKKRGLKNVLVFEDDITARDDWKETLNCALSDLDNFDWHLFFLGWTFDYGKKNLIRPVGECLLEHYGHSKSRGVRNAHALAYNSNIFDYLIEWTNPFDENKNGKRGFTSYGYRRNSNINKYLMDPRDFIQDKSWGCDVK